MGDTVHIADPAAFFARVRASLAGGRLGQGQVEGMEIILAACREAGLTAEQTAYVLATAWHETGRTMRPVREAFAPDDATAVRWLERAWRDGRLGQVSKPYWRPDADGKAWFGRGYVQLTHRENYARMGEAIGVDLVRDPSRALEPETAARILVVGMRDGLFAPGHTLGRYFTERFADPSNARRIVNGTDRARDIAGFFAAFAEAIEAGGRSPAQIHTRGES